MREPISYGRSVAIAIGLTYGFYIVGVSLFLSVWPSLVYSGWTIPEAARHEIDVTNVAPAERHTIEFTAAADPGIYSCTVTRSTTS